MLTLRGSAALLSAASSVDALIRIARHIGFAGEPVCLDEEGRRSLGATPPLDDVTIVPGPGSLRALIFTVSAGSSMREVFSRLAASLASRTPHVLWVLVAAERGGEGLAIGAPSFARRPPRVAALLVDRARIMDSDAESLRLLAAAPSMDDLATHARFVDVLGRDALSRRFFRTLEQCVSALATSASAGSASARSEIALLYASRLLFLGFLESKGWLDDDAAFLTHRFDECMTRGGNFHSRVLLPLFFGTLNTPVGRRAKRSRSFGRIPFLNGGLFTVTATERQFRKLRFDDESLGRFFGDLLSRYRFTALEETSTFEEAAIDPEMLGRTFECLMAGPARRNSGAFYTPHELVERVADCGLEESLAALVGTSMAGSLMRGATIDADDSPRVLRALREMRILDPACGSGAFLVHMLDRLAALHTTAGDTRPVETIRRQVLPASIFGVDINPTAVWLCQLRLWLSIVIEARDATVDSIPPLPNLDRNIRVGDSLAGESFADGFAGGATRLRSLRQRYSRATGVRKASLSRLLDREERRLLVETVCLQLDTVTEARRDLVVARRGRDLFGERYVAARAELNQAILLRDRSIDLRRRLRSVRRGGALPFSFPVHFADVAARGGFSLIIGNPPWVRPHRMDRHSRARLRQRFIVARAASWDAGAEVAGAGRGFSSQVDLAALFVERSLRLLAPGAAMSLLLPAKLWRSLAGGGLRRLVSTEAHLVCLEDYSDTPSTFDASVYPGLLVAARPMGGGRVSHDATPCTRVTVLHRARLATTWVAETPDIAWDESPGAPWILIPPEVRRAFDLIRAAGVPFSSTRFGRPLLGVKCGLNDAFVVAAAESRGSERVRITSSNGREGEIEAAYLRPVVRGECVRRWVALSDGERIIWTHDAHGKVCPTLAPGAQRWFSPFRRSLLARADAGSDSRWWSLFRTEGAAADLPRVIWADIGRSPRAAVLDAADPSIPLNSCYVARCPTRDDAFALAAVLNSPLTAAWLSVVAEPARGGYRRYLGWTMSLLPIPAGWEQHRSLLADLAGRARVDPQSVNEHELLDATIAAFGLTHKAVAPLLAWAAP